MSDTPTSGTSTTTTTVAPPKGLTSNKFDNLDVNAAVDSSGINTGLPPGISGGIYDLDVYPRYELNRMKPSVRADILQILFERGQYGGSKMGNGIDSADVSAFRDLLAWANVQNKDYADALQLYKNQFPVKSSIIAGSGIRAPKQVSNPDDLKAVFKKASMDLLGRTVDDDVANQFVQSFQNQQVRQQTQMATQSGGVVAQAPDAGVSAEKMIEQKFGQEVRVQNAVNFGGIMDQMIKGLAR
jgi:hypothetical protein